MSQSADVVIIGGGVMGCSILYNLARLGVTNSLLVERDVLGSGSTGRSQAICRMHYSNRVTAEMAWESLKIYRDFDNAVGGSSGFVNTGYIVVVEGEEQSGIEKNVALGQALGIETGMVDAEDLRDLAPMVTIHENELAAWEPNSGSADPYRVTTSYASRARDLGARVEMRNPAIGIEISGGRVQAVLTAEGRRETSTAVVASGPWSKQVLGQIGVDVPLVPVRHQVGSFARPLRDMPSHPIVGDIAQSFSFRPDTPVITLCGFGDDEEVDADDYHQGVDMDQVPEVIEKLTRRMPFMADCYYRGGWAGLFTTTPDWHPILDRVPGIEGLYCAVGFSGHGFKLSPMIGVTMAELIAQGQSSTIDINPLRFNRFAEGDLLNSSYRYRVLA